MKVGVGGGAGSGQVAFGSLERPLERHTGLGLCLKGTGLRKSRPRPQCQPNQNMCKSGKLCCYVNQGSCVVMACRKTTLTGL